MENILRTLSAGGHARSTFLEPMPPVSHTVPLITISAATMCHGTALHHWAAREQAGMSIGHKGMLYAARCMAEGTKLLLSKPEYLQAVWDYHNVPQD